MPRPYRKWAWRENFSECEEMISNENVCTELTMAMGQPVN